MAIPIAKSTHASRHAPSAVDSLSSYYVGKGDLLLNVKDFGAKGDGVTNDRAAIQAAIDQAASVGGGIVFLPVGTYIASGLVMKSGVTLTSTGGYRPYVASSPKSIATIAAPAGATGWIIDTPSAQTLSFAVLGLGINGYASGDFTVGTGGIRCQNVLYATFANLAINNHVDQGISYVVGNASTFTDILTTNCLLNRTRLLATGTLDIAGTDHYLHRIEANASMSLTGAISNSSLYVNAVKISGSNNFITDSVGEISDQGWLITGSNNRFSNVRADRNYGHGFQVSGGSNLFSSCTSLDNGKNVDNTYDGFLVSGFGNEFAACSATHTDSGLYKYCFEDTVSNSVATNRNSYVACHATNYSTAAFKTDGFLGSAPSFPAHPVRVADATATPDVTGTSLLILFQFSTPTTITNFINGSVGQSVRLIGSNVVTIANNSSIQTNTGANKALSSNLVYEFTYYNGKWYERA